MSFLLGRFLLWPLSQNCVTFVNCSQPKLMLFCQLLQVGETVSFLLGRFLLRKWVAELTADWPMWAALNAALREDGWKLVLLLRMSPAIPFSVINYALGSSSLPVSAGCVCVSVAHV